jgi:hypothetical protein
VQRVLYGRQPANRNVADLGHGCDANAFGFADTDRLADANANADTNADSNPNADTDADTNANTIADTNADADSDTNAALQDLPAMKLLVAALLIAVASAGLNPPALVVVHADSLNQVDRFANLPAPIQAGSFSVDGTPAKGWEMAEPGAPFQVTDVVSPGSKLPGRRLIAAGCDASVCVVHYERGGIAHFYEILAFSSTPSGWKVVWNARGPKSLENLAGVRSLVKHPSSSAGWTDQWVKGDF